MPLVTRDDLMAPAKSDPSTINAVVSLIRMQDTVNPMPPKPAAPVPSGDIATFQSWVVAGLPPGSCGSGSGNGSSGSGGGPYDTPVVCTSNTYWTLGDHGDPLMHPGRACGGCHVVGGKASGKTFDIAGTVYPTAHEPDDCNGVSGATVVITDANGQEHSLSVNAAGNFYHSDLLGFGKFTVPYHAKVVFNGKERAMTAAQTVGDCNSCHTEAGANMAPGRILLP
jgi:hypothetical protein